MIVTPIEGVHREQGGEHIQLFDQVYLVFAQDLTMDENGAVFNIRIFLLGCLNRC